MSETPPDITWLTRPDGVRLALRQEAGRRDARWGEAGSGCGVMFLHGLMSDMEGQKARAVAAHARHRGWDCLRMDLSGHGSSEGDFQDGTVSTWRDDALLALDAASSGPVILIGSSIGAWIALLVARARPDRIAGMLLIAPAPDMTRRVRAALPDDALAALRDRGVWERPSRYGAPIPITQRMLDDGDAHCLLDRPIALTCPVRVLHGQQDPDVPWQGSLRLAEALQSADVRTILLKDGDHQLSKPHELALMLETLDELRDVASSRLPTAT